MNPAHECSCLGGLQYPSVSPTRSLACDRADKIVLAVPVSCERFTLGLLEALDCAKTGHGPRVRSRAYWILSSSLYRVHTAKRCEAKSQSGRALHWLPPVSGARLFGLVTRRSRFDCHVRDPVRRISSFLSSPYRASTSLPRSVVSSDDPVCFGIRRQVRRSLGWPFLVQVPTPLRNDGSGNYTFPGFCISSHGCSVARVSPLDSSPFRPRIRYPSLVPIVRVPGLRVGDGPGVVSWGRSWFKSRPRYEMMGPGTMRFRAFVFLRMGVWVSPLVSSPFRPRSRYSLRVRECRVSGVESGDGFGEGEPSGGKPQVRCPGCWSSASSWRVVFLDPGLEGLDVSWGERLEGDVSDARSDVPPGAYLVVVPSGADRVRGSVGPIVVALIRDARSVIPNPQHRFAPAGISARHQSKVSQPVLAELRRHPGGLAVVSVS